MQSVGRIVVLFSAIAANAGCAPNTICDIGTLYCDENQVRRCVGPSGGGDADGEIIEVISDCAGMGLTCQIGIGAADVVYGVCATAACVSAHRTQLCPSLGATSCSLDYIDTCSTAEDGCLVWDSGTDCSDTGMSCDSTGGSATCVP